MVTIEEAKNLRNEINIQGKITRKGDKRTVNKKTGGTIDVCDAYIQDDSGEVKLSLWAEDIDKVNEGDTVKITNGYTSTFKGEVAIGKGKFGQLDVV